MGKRSSSTPPPSGSAAVVAPVPLPSFAARIGRQEFATLEVYVKLPDPLGSATRLRVTRDGQQVDDDQEICEPAGGEQRCVIQVGAIAFTPASVWRVTLVDRAGALGDSVVAALPPSAPPPPPKSLDVDPDPTASDASSLTLRVGLPNPLGSAVALRIVCDGTPQPVARWIDAAAGETQRVRVTALTTKPRGGRLGWWVVRLNGAGAASTSPPAVIGATRSDSVPDKPIYVRRSGGTAERVQLTVRLPGGGEGVGATARRPIRFLRVWRDEALVDDFPIDPRAGVQQTLDLEAGQKPVGSSYTWWIACVDDMGAAGEHAEVHAATAIANSVLVEGCHRKLARAEQAKKYASRLFYTSLVFGFVFGIVLPAATLWFGREQVREAAIREAAAVARARASRLTSADTAAIDQEAAPSRALGYQWPFVILEVLAGGMFAVATAMNRMRLQNLDEEIKSLEFEIDLREADPTPDEWRAEKLVGINSYQLRQYYALNLSQGFWVFVVGVVCLLSGLGIIAATFKLIGTAAAAKPGDNARVIATTALGSVGTIAVYFVAAIFLKMHGRISANVAAFHSRLVATHQFFLANMLASRVAPAPMQARLLGRIALVLAQTALTKSASDPVFAPLDDDAPGDASSPTVLPGGGVQGSSLPGTTTPGTNAPGTNTPTTNPARDAADAQALSNLIRR